MRGRFTVTDPQKARGLVLSADYCGGAIVYLNGKELLRQHLPAGPVGSETLAEDYPEEAFVSEDGKLIALRGQESQLRKAELSPETLRRIAGRTRTLKLDIPAAALRAGLNVVAVEIVRAPYHKIVDAHKVTQTYKSKALTHDLSWNTCELRPVQLTSNSSAGLVPTAVRPQDLQVWNSDPLATDFDMDFGDPAEPLRPIRLVGARNGTYSGKVVVGSTQPIKGLKATCGDLAGPGGAKIAAARVRIRYGLRWGVCRTSNEGNLEATAYPAAARPLFALAESPLEEFGVYQKDLQPPKVKASDAPRIAKYGLESFYLDTPGQPAPVPGAVVPVWVTVKVPRDAKPGAYTGRLTITVGGKALAETPVELKVMDWTVPDPDDYQTWVELVQSPDTLALEYGVTPWSDKHFEMIAHSMKYLNEVGSRVLYIPLIAHTNLGNAESMVRWLKKGDGRYEHDFSIMDRYLDVAVKHMGKPKIVVFNVWDLYLYREGGTAYSYVGSQTKQKAGTLAGKGPLVTMVDSSGKTENENLPPYVDPASKALWKPLFDKLRQRMAQRGLEKTMMLGMSTDAWVNKEQVQFFIDIGADLPWTIASHGRPDKPKALYGLADYGYSAHAFSASFGYVESIRGWANPTLNALYERWGGFPPTVITRWRHFPEYAVTGNTRGIGRVGADFWEVVKDKRGQRQGRVSQRYPESSWRQLTLITSVLAPGPEAAVATAKYEAIREGVQDTEARILIERAMADKVMAQKLGPEMVQRCKDVLNERHRAMWISYSTLQMGPSPRHAFAGWRGGYFAGITGYKWFLGSDWQRRCEKLYALAGDVARRLAAE
ncbi:MAG TPA: glycoside hydrolase domain-containing protein, partial [Phycisphaerae bacterium]|nr:glycoside hydrolase domain-containing protein [Phycisphaerae bacterium]